MALSSATQCAILPKFSGKWESECLSIRHLSEVEIKQTLNIKECLPKYNSENCN